MKRILISAFCALLLNAMNINAKTSLKEMKVNDLSAPIGIDTATPTFSWELDSDIRDCKQTSYCISVKSADGTEVWNSGNVDSPQQFGIKYDGTGLKSRTAYTWTVTINCQNGETATAQSTFETAFINSNEWTGKWIGKKVEKQYAAMEIVFDEPVECKNVRLYITGLGIPASTDPNYTFAQLDEMEIYANGENVARNAKFTATSSWDIGNWKLDNINDGKIGDASALGWTTTQNPSTPITVTANLGDLYTVERVVLYPRQDDHAKTGEMAAANFPSNFLIRTATGITYKTQYTAKDIEAPKFSESTYRVPYFGRNFNIAKEVKRARIYASALGVFTMKINGKAVTDAVLEPGESEFEKSILYSTYDVTDLLKSGKNTIIAQVAGGIYNIEYLNGRYSKGEVKNNGETALISELMIEYEDGTTENIVTDESWKTAKSPTIGSNWWGGEDYDARLKIDGIENAEFDVSNWEDVDIITPHFSSPHSGVSGFGTLKSRMYEPLKVVEEWEAVDVKTIKSGGYTLRTIDFGRNFAGQYRFKLKGKAGQKISLRCGESLNPDGSIYMQNYYTGPADTYEEYTFRGDEDGEEWGPEFMYHGFRYLQIIGLDEEPEAKDFTAMRIRSNMENIGHINTSNTLINDIHTICRDAIASQLYNSITDCPQREKLGWLDVPNEMYVSLNSNFNMQNLYKKVVMDCFDAQQANGMVPSVSPFYMNVYVDDTNWGGAAILVPYRNWKYYGDKSLLAPYYNQMKKLIDHYTACTTNYIINNSFSVLSDWGQETAGVSPMVPTEFTETTTYYYLLKAMAEIATELSHPADAEKYDNLATNVKNAFNKKFHNSQTSVYTSVSGGGGRQSEQAMPLYYGLVPDGDEEKVAAVLAQKVKNDSYKIKTGEIALKPVFMTLAQYGYNDVVWEMANQTDCPSYGYWVMQGYTTTPEYWDVGAFSQNHCMMDHIEEWFFTELGGIQNAGMAFDKINIRPYFPADLNSCDISTKCNYGTIRTAWQRTTDGYNFQFTVPQGTEANIVVPIRNGQVLKENGKEIPEGTNGIISVAYEGDIATIVVGGGKYEFTAGEGDVIEDTSGIDEIKNKINSQNGKIYDLSGRLVSESSSRNLKSGIYIIDGHKRFVK